MKETKTTEQISDEFFEFKSTFSHVFYLMKLFHFLYFQITEEQLYPEDDEYIAKNCLYFISEAINQILNKANKQMINLYEDFSKIQEDYIYA